jgi:membrane protein YdbS with pleckstrin-like domain
VVPDDGDPNGLASTRLPEQKVEPMIWSAVETITAVGLNGRAYYIHWGWFQISAANLAVIVAMVVVFALAIVVPFRRRDR